MGALSTRVRTRRRSRTGDEWLARGIVQGEEGWRLSQDPRTFGVAGAPFDSLVKSARARVILARGERDAMVSTAELRAHAAEAVEIAGCGHNVQVEKPDAIVELLQSLMRERGRAASAGRGFRSQQARSGVLRESLSGVRGAARLRSGASLSGRHVLPQPLRRPRPHLSRPYGLQLRQEAGIRAEVRHGLAALRASHDQPGVQRRALSHARAATDRRRAHASRAQGDGARRGHAGRHAAGSHGGAG